MPKLGPSFPDEYAAAGLVGSPLVVNTDTGEFIRNGATEAQVVTLQAVIAANEPNGSLTWRRKQQRAVINTQRDANVYTSGMPYTLGGITYTFQVDRDSRSAIRDAMILALATSQLPAGFYLRTTDNQNIACPDVMTLLDFFRAMVNWRTAIRVLSTQTKDQLMTSSNPEAINMDMTKLASVSDPTMLPSPMLNLPQVVMTTTQTAKGQQEFPVTVGTAGAVVNVDISAMKLTAPPSSVIPVAVGAGGQIYLAVIAGTATKTSVPVVVWRSKGTLLLTAGPFESAPAGSAGRISVVP